MKSELLTSPRTVIQLLWNRGSKMVMKFAVSGVIEDWDTVSAAFDFGARVSRGG